MTREEVREASGRLPERQREALELRDGDERSYEEIAASLEMSSSAVAQLIAHARINLYDELRGTALASVAPSPDCERALPLIAMREDGQLAATSEPVRWLDSHLADCERCTLAVAQMREAEAAYRAQGSADRSPADRSSGKPVQLPAVPEVPGSGRRPRPRVMAAVASAALLLLLAGLAVAFTGNERPTPTDPAAGATTGPGAEGSERDAKPIGRADAKRGSGKSGSKKENPAADSAIPPDGAAGTTAAAAVGPTSGSSSGTGGSDGQGDAPGSGRGGTGPKGAPGQTAVEPTRQTAATKPSSKPKPPPTSTTAAQPTPAPAPAPESPPAEEPADRPGRSEEAPGKPDNRPSK